MNAYASWLSPLSSGFPVPSFSSRDPKAITFIRRFGGWSFVLANRADADHNPTSYLVSCHAPSAPLATGNPASAYPTLFISNFAAD
ncbi:hypothetical protein HETIRDRAFT_420593 [Heterobasidion irregulare TC 32-1]|uniref:Uncharacterized protein n=1 Tax=Heterobasidion irregulare (strain TC 32-1) TaxID=747525 RepID=W4JWB7_HETIT|nr:uncharacterized protein HETIRDRAFT_420593 [Heterobasidion irregulare TC 32-1]ETW77759.1 hypothetical protein HETIRDRAFT_420593 [Heterobasidion irregulare TC 32-1]